MSTNMIFHTYAEASNGPGPTWVRAAGVDVRVQSSRNTVVFMYFHPLSRPHIEPPPDQIAREIPIVVSGRAVLRFGFIEGEAVVTAGRAVYDPQTSERPRPFAENGSTARELALVLNISELLALSGASDEAAAIDRLFSEHSADIVVTKRGTAGATVHQRGQPEAWISAYRTERVFKIGTGDVFSGLFAHHWAELGRDPATAADLASRAVAEYCVTRKLPLERNAGIGLFALPKPSRPAVAAVAGANDTLGRRWLLAEARYRLRELGVSVPYDDDAEPHSGGLPAALLVLADGLRGEPRHQVVRAITGGSRVIVLAERAGDWDLGVTSPSVEISDDFTSAIYRCAWAAGTSAGCG
jgi:hypothetical protein